MPERITKLTWLLGCLSQTIMYLSELSELRHANFANFPPHQVKLGPTYLFAIKGRCSPPSLEFSFTRHDFGKCLLHRSGMVPASTTLVICNKGLKDVGCRLLEL